MGLWRLERFRQFYYFLGASFSVRVVVVVGAAAAAAGVIASGVFCGRGDNCLLN